MKLGDICRFRNEKIELKYINKNDYISTDNMLPNFGGVGELKTIPNSEKVNKYCKNDILLSNIRPYFKKMIYSNKDSGCSSDVLVFETIDENINPEYLYYRLMNNDFFDYVVSTSKGTKMPRGDKKAIMNFEIKIPSLAIQNKIVEILKNIDNMINVNNMINDNLYKLIRNNYESLIASGDWKDKELGTISNITSGKRPINKLKVGKYPVIGANGIMAYTSDYNFDEDLIITGRVGTLGVVKRYSDCIWASDNTLVIQTKYLNYIENYLKTIDYYSLNRGSTQPLLTQSDLKKQIIIFNEDLVEKFEKDNQIFVDNIRNNDIENKKLEQLRDTLLPRLINGEIDIDNIEI